MVCRCGVCCLYCHSELVEESFLVSALVGGCFYENILSSAKIFSIKRRYARTTRLKHEGVSVTPSVSRGPVWVCALFVEILRLRIRSAQNDG